MKPSRSLDFCRFLNEIRVAGAFLLRLWPCLTVFLDVTVDGISFGCNPRMTNIGLEYFAKTRRGIISKDSPDSKLDTIPGS